MKANSSTASRNSSNVSSKMQYCKRATYFKTMKLHIKRRKARWFRVLSDTLFNNHNTFQGISPPWRVIRIALDGRPCLTRIPNRSCCALAIDRLDLTAINSSLVHAPLCIRIRSRTSDLMECKLRTCIIYTVKIYCPWISNNYRFIWLVFYGWEDEFIGLWLRVNTSSLNPG